MPVEPGQQPPDDAGVEPDAAPEDEFDDDLVIPLEPTRNGW